MTGVQMIENQPLRLLKVLGHGHNGSGIGGFQRTNKSEASCWSGGQNQNAGAAFRRKTKRLRHFVHYVGRLSSCRSGFGRVITGLPLGMPASRKMKSEKEGCPGRPFIYRQRFQLIPRERRL